MGTLTSHSYDVAEGLEWCTYLDRIVGECHRLRQEGRLPDSDGVDAFLADLVIVLRKVRGDVNAATSRGERTITTAIPMTSEEHKRIVSMSESILNLLEILEMRKAVVLDRSPAVARVAAALIG